MASKSVPEGAKAKGSQFPIKEKQPFPSGKGSGFTNSHEGAKRAIMGLKYNPDGGPAAFTGAGQLPRYNP